LQFQGPFKAPLNPLKTDVSRGPPGLSGGPGPLGPHRNSTTGVLNMYKYIYCAMCFSCCVGSSVVAKIETGVTEHNDEPSPYLGTVCDKRSTGVHRELDTEENQYACTQCEKCFSNVCYLRKHMNVHSSKYKCIECGKCFRNNYHLTRHMQQTQSHSIERKFECTVCTKRFATSYDRDRHSRTHGGEKPYKCYVCEKAFSRCEHLRRHMTVHSADKPFKCSRCNKSFQRSDQLENHKRCRYSCRYCSKHFATLVRLEFHLLKSHEGT